jgi:hypothetical protein
MTDSYVASPGMISAPGAIQAYNNCGYYLLSRVVAKLRNAATPAEAYETHLSIPFPSRASAAPRA